MRISSKSIFFLQGLIAVIASPTRRQACGDANVQLFEEVTNCDESTPSSLCFGYGLDTCCVSYGELYESAKSYTPCNSGDIIHTTTIYSSQNGDDCAVYLDRGYDCQQSDIKAITGAKIFKFGARSMMDTNSSGKCAKLNRKRITVNGKVYVAEINEQTNAIYQRLNKEERRQWIIREAKWVYNASEDDGNYSMDNVNVKTS